MQPLTKDKLDELTRDDKDFNEADAMPHAISEAMKHIEQAQEILEPFDDYEITTLSGTLKVAKHLAHLIRDRKQKEVYGEKEIDNAR